MKAKFVNEDINFTREGEPLDKLGLGNPIIRKVNESWEYLNSIRQKGYAVQDLNFPDLISKAENLGLMVDVVVMEHMKSKFHMRLLKPENEYEGFAYTKIDGYWLYFLKSSSGKSVIFKLMGPPHQFRNTEFESTASTNLKTLDAKITALIKKFNFKFE